MYLSAREEEFLSTLASTGQSIFELEQALDFWKSRANASNALSRLVRKGWLKRIDRGVYLIVPLEAGPDRAWSESALVIAPYLVKPSAIAYWSAMHYWNMTEQLPQVVFVQTTRRKRSQEYFGVQYRFVTVKESRFFGILQRPSPGKPISITDREKTLLDAAARPDLCGGIIQLAQALKTAASDVDWEKLDRYLIQWGGGTVLKRLGYLTEAMSLPLPNREKRLERWRRSLTQGISQLEPGMGATGPTVTRWRIQVNVDLRHLHGERVAT